jgi:hypothetical protein
MRTHFENNTRRLKTEDGSIVVIAVLMLAFLSLLGISSTTTSTTEVQIAGNERHYKQNLYKAEAAAMEAVQRLENITDKQVLMGRSLVWLHTDDIMTSSDSWDYDDAGGDDNSESASFSIDPNSTTFYSAVDFGIASGSSLSMGGTQLHEYIIYGLTTADNGQALVEVGYRKRF